MGRFDVVFNSAILGFLLSGEVNLANGTAKTGTLGFVSSLCPGGESASLDVRVGDHIIAVAGELCGERLAHPPQPSNQDKISNCHRKITIIFLLFTFLFHIDFAGAIRLVENSVRPLTVTFHRSELNFHKDFVDGDEASAHPLGGMMRTDDEMVSSTYTFC